MTQEQIDAMRQDFYNDIAKIVAKAMLDAAPTVGMLIGLAIAEQKLKDKANG